MHPAGLEKSRNPQDLRQLSIFRNRQSLLISRVDPIFYVGSRFPFTLGEEFMVNAVDFEAELIVEQRAATDRRVRPDRRQPAAEAAATFVGEERRQGVRRAKVERRRQIDPTTCERDYTSDEIEFMKAMDDYKRRSGRQFPTWSEVLEVVRSLGYNRV